MPRYDYVCTKCDKLIEIKHGFHDAPPNCDCGHTLTRRFTAASIRFVGKGFYSTGG